jgi:uncharacterized protein (DUF1499 family)
MRAIIQKGIKMNFIKLSIKSTLLVSSLLLTACAGKVPSDLGALNGSELRACPDKPNCVQTYSPADESHFQLPLTAKATDEKTKQAISAAISKTGGQIISDEPLKPSGYYLHAEYQSDWMKFVDDVEIVIKDGLIHIRSASRLGYSDMGVNASRLEDIKTAYDD